MIKRQHVTRNFFDGAEAMRQSLDACFNDAYANKISWQYFCAPGIYTYLRAEPHAAIPRELFSRFMQQMRQWSVQTLGLSPTHDPWLNMMVNGCRLEMHSDFHNGTWGWVFSLTRWDDRKFSGGETLLMRDGVPSYKRHHVHGEVLYELIPAHFNQLLVFDDRIAHATPVIEGNMNPLDSRIAIVGHLRAIPPVIDGPIDQQSVRAAILRMLKLLRGRVADYKEVQGTQSCRLRVGTSGKVESVDILTDNLVTAAAGYGASEPVEAVKAIIAATLTDLRFSAAAADSSIILAILVPVPSLEPLTISVRHSGPVAAVQTRVAAYVNDTDASGLSGHWQNETFTASEPVAGTIRIGTSAIEASFDPPMWVPSQRDQFEQTLTKQLQAVSGR